MSRDELPIIDPKSRKALRAWLTRHHRSHGSAWLIIYKKHMGPKFLSVTDVVEELLCFGWIDSLPRKKDADTYLLLISRRKPKSVWSLVNKQKIRSLIKQKLMTDHGLQTIAAAKKNGSWSALDKSDKMIVPDELKSDLAFNPLAEKNFHKFAPSSRKAILEWIYSSKTEATRKKRIAKTVEMAAKGLKANLVK